MNKPDVVFIGDIAFNRDITPQGERVSLGGAAYYCAKGAQASARPGIVAKVGSDYDLSRLHRFDSRGVTVESGKTCAFTVTQHADNTRDFSADRGVAQAPHLAGFPTEFFAAQFIHLATQLPDHALLWFEHLQAYQGTTSFDTFEAFVTDFPTQTQAALQRADMIFVNSDEFQSLRRSGYVFPSVPLIVKLGKQGAVYKDADQEFHVPAPQVEAIETTGAGDVLAGAFLAEMSQGKSVELALEYAVLLASKSVTAFGVEHL